MKVLLLIVLNLLVESSFAVDSKIHVCTKKKIIYGKSGAPNKWVTDLCAQFNPLELNRFGNRKCSMIEEQNSRDTHKVQMAIYAPTEQSKSSKILLFRKAIKIERRWKPWSRQFKSLKLDYQRGVRKLLFRLQELGYCS